MQYYRVLAFQQALTCTEENLRLVQRAVELSERQFRAGQVSEFDVNLSRTGALDVQEELITTRGLLEQARMGLALLLGLSTRVRELELTDTLPTVPRSVPAADDLLDRALDERFDVRIAWFGARRAEAALRLECRRFLPDVQLGFAFERGEQRALPGRKILADTARASIAAGQLHGPEHSVTRRARHRQIADYRSEARANARVDAARLRSEPGPDRQGPRARAPGTQRV